MRMNDNASIAFRLALPGKALTVLPRGISPVRQLWLAASIPQRRERDDYLWDRAHRTAMPGCPLCESSSSPSDTRPQGYGPSGS